MFSGKTTSLIKKFQTLPAENKFIFAHGDSQRFSKDHVQTHDGVTQRAFVINDFAELKTIAKSESDWVFIDEIHFFSESCVYESFHDILAYYKQVFIGGLDYDFRKIIFPWFKNMLTFREQYPHVRIHQLKGTCHLCGGVSKYTMKQRSTEHVLEKGGAELYHAACEQCWALPPQDVPQES